MKLWSPCRGGEFLFDALGDPLAWATPTDVRVAGDADLFHAEIAPEHVAAAFGIMAVCPQHRFRLRTSNVARATAWHRWIAREARVVENRSYTYEADVCRQLALSLLPGALAGASIPDFARPLTDPGPDARWPLPNVSIETREGGVSF